MKYIKSFNESVDNSKELTEMFNLIISEPQVYTVPYGYFSGVDFNIYIISGGRVETDDDNFMQELYNNHNILNKMYNMEIFYVGLTKTESIIVLYDYIMKPGVWKQKNHLGYIPKSKIEKHIPNTVLSKINFTNKIGSDYVKVLYRGVDYSNGGGGNLALFDWKYGIKEDK